MTEQKPRAFIDIDPPYCLECYEEYSARGRCERCLTQRYTACPACGGEYMLVQFGGINHRLCQTCGYRT